MNRETRIEIICIGIIMMVIAASLGILEYKHSKKSTAFTYKRKIQGEKYVAKIPEVQIPEAYKAEENQEVRAIEKVRMTEELRATEKIRETEKAKETEKVTSEELRTTKQVKVTEELYTEKKSLEEIPIKVIQKSNYEYTSTTGSAIQEK